ncbi:hypothetical protein predicted by Glimmer/Critica [Salmonella enterica subsp. enterica serovar Weltevreden str. 2007-60-3289-1]|nr:hypothetical protein predicted by Glimmer/Critica [Salmonella enterica subsp. enterica serovar Weltevreden str. 2007-60-3289-1]
MLDQVDLKANPVMNKPLNKNSGHMNKLSNQLAP